MNLLVELVDEYVYKDYWPSLYQYPLTTPFGVFVKCLVTLTVGAEVSFLFVSSLLYYYVCVLNKEKYFPNRTDKEYNVKLELLVTVLSIPFMAVHTTILVFPEFFGYSFLYDNIEERGYVYWAFSDWAVYWIHRWLHTPWAYANIHQRHHWFKTTTPFAAYAFHPLDGSLQSVPYHLFALVFPMHKMTYMVLFSVVLIWTITIHSGITPIQGWGLNGPAHHTIHHSRFKFNYGQYFTFWDKLEGSYMEPEYEWQLDKAKLPSTQLEKKAN